jgi:hypothetical protein
MGRGPCSLLDEYQHFGSYAVLMFRVDHEEKRAPFTSETLVFASKRKWCHNQYQSLNVHGNFSNNVPIVNKLVMLKYVEALKSCAILTSSGLRNGRFSSCFSCFSEAFTFDTFQVAKTIGRR